MADLWVLVPSRGRPANVERLVRACALTCTADTKLHFAFDDDDEHLNKSIAMTGGHRYTVGPRDSLAGWTNDLAARHIRRGDADALASVGDDMVPKTHGWDTALLGAVQLRGGFAYPEVERGLEHGRQPGIPEAVVISAAVVRALGGMVPRGPDGRPLMSHWFIDNVWRDLADGACGGLAYVPVVVKHMHPNVPGGDRPDQTYYDAAVRWAADNAAYCRWRVLSMRADIDRVRRAMKVTA